MPDQPTPNTAAINHQVKCMAISRNVVQLMLRVGAKASNQRKSDFHVGHTTDRSARALGDAAFCSNLLGILCVAGELGVPAFRADGRRAKQASSHS
jgi:hypothetical protein